jgi:hypothetical protein
MLPAMNGEEDVRLLRDGLSKLFYWRISNEDLLQTQSKLDILTRSNT